MPRFLCSCIIALFLTSCGSDGDVLSRAKMEKVLWDVAQSNEFLNGYVLVKHPGLNRAALNNAMLDRVFKVHKISKEEFDNSMEYYRRKPDQLKEVLDTIIARQNRLMGKDTKTPEDKDNSSAEKNAVPL